MRHLLLPIALVITGLFACSAKEPLDIQNQNHPLPTASPVSEDVLLEVVTIASGSVYPKEGEILHMRLFKDGRFEYDDFPDVDPPRHSSFNVSITRKEATLSKEDVEKLVSLAKSSEFLSAKDEYKGIQPHTDTRWVTTISFNGDNVSKRIKLENFWDVEYVPKLKSNYPAQLIELLENVEIMKAKAIGKSSTQWMPKRSANKPDGKP